MIELSPKALRFARLAAEETFFIGDEPCVSELGRKETEHRTGTVGSQAKRSEYLLISDDLARFCLKSICSVLAKPTVLGDDWDDNDLMFLKSVSTHLSESLSSAARPEAV